MKEETKTCLKQPDEQLFIFASFELNCFNTVSERAQCRWGRGKKKQNNVFSFCSPCLRSICQCPTVLQLWAECLQGLRPGWVGCTWVGWRLLKDLSSTRSSNYNTERSCSCCHWKERRVIRTNVKTVEKQGFMHGRDKEDGKKRALIGCLNCVQRARWGIYWAHLSHSRIILNNENLTFIIFYLAIRASRSVTEHIYHSVKRTIFVVFPCGLIK